MPGSTEPQTRIPFGPFEADLLTQELRKHGIRLPLPRQSFQILKMLLERRGELVTRDELRAALWPSDTFVDFEHGLNSAVNKLRDALGDTADDPRYIETLPRRGYRYVGGAVEAEPGPVQQSAAQPAQSSSFSLVAAAKQHRWGVAAGAFAVLCLLGAAGFGFYSLLHRPAPTPFQKFTITQVTNTGKATDAAISPDGRYVLNVMDDNGLESIWLRNVPTDSDTQIIPPSVSHYDSLTFSPDGNYFYFCKKAHEANPFASDLYRSPILGGTPQMVLRNVCPTLSPDGQRIVYLRGDDPEVGKYRLITASLDGSDEKVLQIGAVAEEAPNFLDWSPKGDEIFYSLGDAINVLDARTGKSHRFVSFKDKFPLEIRWSPDNLALFAIYRGKSVWGSWGQIGFVRATGGDIEPITRDTNRYTTLTLSADGRTLATVLARSYATISVLTKVGQQFVEPRLLLSQASEFNDWSGLSWAADGSLLVSDTVRVLKLGADGKNRAQLLADSSAVIPTASPCGANYLVLTWAGHGSTNSENIWRTNADGSSPLKLTDGWNDTFPVCSPDQKWVYYKDCSENHISRVPLDGSGKPEAIVRLPQNYDIDFGTDVKGGLAVSPDGKSLAALVGDVGRQAAPIKIALFELGSASPPRMLDVSHYSGSDLQFTSDGKSVAYVLRENGVDNVMVQPLNGSAGHPITDFKSEQIWSFSLSPDGKSLAVLRGHYDSDVVLLQESKP